MALFLRACAGVFTALLSLAALAQKSEGTHRVLSGDLMLKEFRPRPMLHLPEHRVERARFPVMHWDYEPTPNPSREGNGPAGDERRLPSWEGSGVGRFRESPLFVFPQAFGP